MAIDRKLVAMLGVVVLVSAYLPVAALIVCRDGNCPGAAAARDRQSLLRDRDPDKASLWYWPLVNAGWRDTNWTARYGSSLTPAASDTVSDDVAAFTVDQWRAVDGPDHVACRMTVRFRAHAMIDYIIAPVARGAAC